MKTLSAALALTFWCFLWTTIAQAQTANSQAPPPLPDPTITLIGAKASPAGLNVDLQAAHLGEMGFQVDRQDKTTGSWIPIVTTLYMPVPADIRETAETVSNSFVVPLIMPGKDVFYRLSIVGKAKPGDKRDWTNSNLLTFYGFDTTQKAIANSIALQFSEDTLTISTKTDDKVILKASWQVGENGTPFGLQATSNMQNPSVALSYKALSTDTSAGFPAMDIGLFDENGTKLQEAKISVKVATNQAVATKVASVKNESSTSGKSSSTKFSWSDLLKTGLGALMKYFTIGL